MILDEPVNAVEGAAAFFIGSKSDDDVAVRNEIFFFVLNKIGNPDGGLGFVVAGTAAVEVAVILGQLKWINGPIFALRFHDIDVGEKEGFVFTGPVVTNDEVLFFGIGAAEKNIGIGKAGGFQASRGGFRDGRCGAGGEAGRNFNELLVDVASESFFRVGAGGLGVESCDQKK